MSELLARYREHACSVELWPARSPEQERRLDATLEVLRERPPAFVSVTYGAFGSNRERSLELLSRVREEGHEVLAHLAVAGHDEGELRRLLRDVSERGATGVLALRGDPPLNDASSTAPTKGRHALELVELARAETTLEVAVAVHPGGHPDASSRAEDLRFQAAKLARSDFGVTQFYFRHRELLELCTSLRRLGSRTPIVAGLLVPTSLRQLRRMGEMARVTLPSALVHALEGPQGRLVARHWVLELAEAAQRAGSAGVHLFSMNDPETTAWLLERLGPAVAVG